MKKVLPGENYIFKVIATPYDLYAYELHRLVM